MSSAPVILESVGRMPCTSILLCAQYAGAHLGWTYLLRQKLTQLIVECMVGYWSATRDGLDLLHLIQIGCIHIGVFISRNITFVSEFWGLVTPFRNLFCSWSVFRCLQEHARNAPRTANRPQMAGVRWYDGSHIWGVKTSLRRFWIQTMCALAWFRLTSWANMVSTRVFGEKMCLCVRVRRAWFGKYKWW